MITGAGGMLGSELAGLLRLNGTPVAALSRRDLDVTDTRAVRAAVARHRPDVIVNCAAWTDFHGAEGREPEVLRINGTAVAGLAAVCADAAVRLIQISTSYVFDGTARCPYAEDAQAVPISVYGRTKLTGEQAAAALAEAGQAAIVRTAWLYGRHGTNFVAMMAELERTRQTVEAVADGWGQPTWTADVARQIVAIADSGAAGVFHATSGGGTSRYGQTRELFRLLGADPARVKPVGRDRFPGPARRPTYSVLGHEGWKRAGLAPIPDWREALAVAFPRLGLA
jgi:dTDP-4-dehydrorhamnose reductase